MQGKIWDNDEPTVYKQCVSDEILINTLLPYYPSIAAAEIKRDGDIIKIVKTAGAKG